MQIELKNAGNLYSFSDDGLYDLCRKNRLFRIERNSKLHLIFKPIRGFAKSLLIVELCCEIQFWNKKLATGKITLNGGYILPNGAMRAPDVAWISREKVSSISKAKQKKFLPACPDFVIELRSESDNLSELKAKMEEGLENGTQLGWLIDPKEKQTHIYQPNQEIVIQNFAADLSGKNVLAGFSVNLIELFELEDEDADNEES